MRRRVTAFCYSRMWLPARFASGADRVAARRPFYYTAIHFLLGIIVIITAFLFQIPKTTSAAQLPENQTQQLINQLQRQITDLERQIMEFGIAPSTKNNAFISISGITVSTTENKSIIFWKTNKPASGKIYFADNANAQESKWTQFSAPNSQTSQSITVTGLKPNTTYWYFIETKDQSENSALSRQLSFKTAP